MALKGAPYSHGKVNIFADLLSFTIIVEVHELSY